jgi:hypothetical protein
VGGRTDRRFTYLCDDKTEASLFKKKKKEEDDNLL